MFLLPLVVVTSTLSQTPLNVESLDFTASTVLSFSQQNTESETKDIESSSWGTPETWRWGVVGGYGNDVKESDNTITTLGLEFEYFVEEDLSIDLGFLFMDVDQKGGDANGFNFTLQLRWHLMVEEDWSFFVEGGVGLLRTSENVPIGGSKFNFTPQAGFGLSFDVGDNDARWLVGLKWHHISNANLYDSNPGRDSWQVWTGISFPF